MLASILKNLRQERGLTQSDLARQLNVSQQAVAKWEAGRAYPTSELLLSLANTFAVSTDYLLGQQAATPSGVWLPIVGQVKAGYNALAYEEDYGHELANVQSPEQHFYLLVQGDSMEPLIHNGDLALIRQQPSLENGDLGVVIYGDDESTLKRFRKQKGRVLLEPFNPMYKTLELAGAELEQLRIIGRVLETRKRW